METRKTLWKWFWIWDFEKEEEWLNEMALNGWVLDGVGFCTYHFVRCEPGEYAVRLEMHGRDDAYVDFMEETGAEYTPYSRRSANERKPYRLVSSSFSYDCVFFIPQN